MKTIFADIDIDVRNKSDITDNFACIPAIQGYHNDKVQLHNSGVFFQDIPVDPMTSYSSLLYKDAERIGYQKIDILNNHAYDIVRDREHLKELISMTPRWDMLTNRDFVNELYHVNKNFDLLQYWLPTSITELSLFLAMIRPAKKHLLSCTSWDELVTNGIWEKPTDGSYALKKAHSVAYAQLIVVQMNAIVSLATLV